MADPHPIGYWLRLIENLINSQFDATLDEHGITRLQWQLLNALAAGPQSVVQLDGAVRPFLVGIGEQSSINHLTELIESGWVDATPTGYELTARGHAARDRLSNVVAGQRADMAAGVSPEDYATSVKTLEKIARNLGWAGKS
jgi:DNA-binding MarR family transcriptional regulator